MGSHAIRARSRRYTRGSTVGANLLGRTRLSSAQRSNIMPVMDGVCCQVCGSDDALVHCSACAERLRDRGVRISLCSTCLTDERSFEGIAKLLPASSTDGFNFTCNICVASNRRAERDRLLRLVGGPSPEELLNTIADNAPWHLVLKAAAPEELMTASTKVKRKLDYSTTSMELADSLAMRDPLGRGCNAQGRQSLDHENHGSIRGC